MQKKLASVALAAGAGLLLAFSPIAAAETARIASPTQDQEKWVWIVIYKKNKPDGSIGVFRITEPRFDAKAECDDWLDEAADDHPEWLQYWCNYVQVKPTDKG